MAPRWRQAARRLERRLRAGRPAPRAASALDQARPIRSIDEQAELAEGAIDVDELLGRLSVAELAESADRYYRQNLDGADYYFAKPFGSVSEAPDYLMTFGQVLAALDLAAGMRVLDFGAGTGWTSRYLTQLGCEVVVSDVSVTALDLARQLYERQPVAGQRPAPAFQRFDGDRIDLPDASVDRILCFDALHHTPNPAEVLREFGRVLRPGGRAAFSEPGPNHSKTAQSQFEMKNYVVVENDIRIRQIEAWAADAGFCDLRLAAFTSQPFHLSPGGYERLLAGREEAGALVEHHREFLENRRIFYLQRAGHERRDSRVRDGLAGRIEVELTSRSRESLQGRYVAVNTGRNHWLASDAEHGPVRVGVHLYDHDGLLVERDYARIALAGAGGVAPGETSSGRFEVPAPPEAGAVLEFDLVAEGVAWFEINGTVPARPVMP